MAKQSVDEASVLLKQLRSDAPLGRLYLLYGEDSFIVERLISVILNKRFGGNPPDSLSFEQYRAGDSDVQRVIDAVKTMSMFGGVKLVIYRDLERLNEEELKRLCAYAENPVRAHLVLVATKIDGRKKSWSTLKKAAQTAECTPLSDWQIVDYIRAEAKASKLNFDANAAETLADCIGPNRAIIERALEKLSLAVTNDQIISSTFITDHIVETRERSVFELTKALSKRDIPACLSALHVLIEQRQEPIMINGLLARHARQMIQVKLGQAMRLSNDEIMKKSGITYYAMRECLEGASKYSMNELFQFHSKIFECDRDLKSKPIPNPLILAKVLMSLMKP